MRRATIVPANFPEDIEVVRVLFTDYANTLDVALDYQNFDRELSSLPGMYEQPAGIIYVARLEGHGVGCIALRRLSDGIAELKRLFVQPDYRGCGIASRLLQYAVNYATDAGYAQLYLDTLPSMSEATALYQARGFTEMPAYYDTPVQGTRFFRLALEAS